MIRNQTLLAIVIVTLMLPSAVHAEYFFARGETMTPVEAGLLDPVCKLILVEKPRIHEDENKQTQNAALFNRPEYRMAKNALALHHRCWATVWRMRYFNAVSAIDKNTYMAKFHGDMNFMINTTRYLPPNWEYMPLMHVEIGEMYLWDKKYTEATSEAYKALNQNPDFAQAYSLLIKVYIAIGQKKKALDTITEGLKRNPQSRTLKRAYDEAGGKPPYPEPYAQPPEPEPVAPTIETKSPDGAPPVAEQSKQSETTTAPPSAIIPESPPKPNPYCRFCP